MVSLSLWTSISAGRLAEQLRETPEYAPHMQAAAERKAGALRGGLSVNVVMWCSSILGALHDLNVNVMQFRHGDPQRVL